MASMDEKTARRYRDDDRLPSQRKKPRNYRTRRDPFAGVWSEVESRLEAEPQLMAKTLFEWLQDRYPGRYPDSTRRTFERRVRLWRSTQGPDKTVMFPQIHHPGQIAASDFTVMNELRITVSGVPFDHMLYHCVLTYSNVESVSLCFSESFEALSEGIQNAFWEFGGVPKRHRTDSLSAAVNNHSSRKELTARYAALMDHYGCEPERINVRCANENGDVESSHGHLKTRVDQALLLRGSRDFTSREDYMEFVRALINRANAARQDRFAVEQSHLSRLPDSKLDTDDLVQGISVAGSSTIKVKKNIYSVPSRLIGQKVDVKISAEWIEVTHHGIDVQRMPRLTGVGESAINYRHVIDSLVRKPGAFENYKYRQDLFPTSHFRIAYDMLCDAHSEKVAVRKYLEILQLAAHESQDAVQDALRHQITSDEPINVDSIRQMINEAFEIKPVTDVEVEPPDLKEYDCLHPTFDKESPTDESEDNSQDPITDDTFVVGQVQQDESCQHQTADGNTDRTVPQSSATDVSRPFSSDGRPSGSGEAKSCRVPGRADESGMPSSSRESHQSADDELSASAGQDLGDIQVRSTSFECDATIGKSPRRVVSGSSRERSDLWASGRWQEPCTLCACQSTGPARTEHAVNELQLIGATTPDCKTGSSAAEVYQAVITLRGTDDRRPWLRPTEPGGDGSVVHVVGGTLRTRQCAVDEQLGVQQMGSDIQRRDDDSSRDRSPGTPQRDHRVECVELSCRNCEANEVRWTITEEPQTKIDFVIGNSSCR
jgi:hypothetical protein